eukprot:gnl/Trimastix_PCT/4888.p1 GENE.gnl/Trimastix_PCT/4888~~gnl/Trimastix_PCT/4888.p1  ORF type:complete len:200 (-),score=9.71 gnl/Trimastix_PCT/4888:144-743(-)
MCRLILFMWARVVPVTQSFFQQHDNEDRSSLILQHDSVLKRYPDGLARQGDSNGYSPQRNLLMRFYQDPMIKDTPFIEHLVNPTKDEKGRYPGWFKLIPLGVDLPIPPEGPPLASCLKDILTALSGIHAAGYVHCDVRDENVVYHPETHHWYLIDCEFVTLIGSEVAFHSRFDRVPLAPGRTSMHSPRWSPTRLSRASS